MASSMVGLTDRDSNEQISHRFCGEDFELRFGLLRMIYNCLEQYYWGGFALLLK